MRSRGRSTTLDSPRGLRRPHAEPSYGNSYCPSVAQVLDALTMAERPASERQLRRWWLRGWVDDDALHLRLQQLADAGITLCVRTPWGPHWTFCSRPPGSGTRRCGDAEGTQGQPRSRRPDAAAGAHAAAPAEGRAEGHPPPGGTLMIALTEAEPAVRTRHVIPRGVAADAIWLQVRLMRRDCGSRPVRTSPTPRPFCTRGSGPRADETWFLMSGSRARSPAGWSTCAWGSTSSPPGGGPHGCSSRSCCAQDGPRAAIRHPRTRLRS